MASKPQSELERDFSSIKRSSKSLEGQVKAINTDRDKLINDTALDVITENYLRTHYGSKYDDYITSGGTREDFILSIMSLDAKIDAVSQYTNIDRIFGGENGFEAKLRDTQKIKAERKQRYAKRGREILREYKEALDRNQERIEKLEQEIEEIKQRIKTAEEKKLEAALKDDETINRQGSKATYDKAGSISRIEAQIAELEGKLASKETELKGFKELQAKFRAEFVKRRDELTAFLEEEKIFISDDITRVDADSSNTQEQSQETIVNGGNIGDKPLSNHAISTSMLKDFIDRSPEEQKLLLEQCGSKDILNMARKLDPVSRRRLNTTLRRRLNEMEETSVIFDTETISKNDLLSGRLTEQQCKAVQKEIDDFNKNITQKTPEEIQEFESRLKYIRMACLLRERGGLLRFAQQILNSKVEGHMHDLSSSIARYGFIKDKLVRGQEDWVDSIRVAIGRSPKNSITRTETRKLDRTNSNPLERE